MYDVFVDLNSNGNDRNLVLKADNMISKSIRELLYNLMEIGFTGDIEIYCTNTKEKDEYLSISEICH